MMSRAVEIFLSTSSRRAFSYSATCGASVGARDAARPDHVQVPGADRMRSGGPGAGARGPAAARAALAAGITTGAVPGATLPGSPCARGR